MKKFTSDYINNHKYNIAIAGTGYVGLSLAVLLAQHNHVTAVDIVPEKVELINNRRSPIHDDYIENIYRKKNWILLLPLMPSPHIRMPTSS